MLQKTKYVKIISAFFIISIVNFSAIIYGCQCQWTEQLDFSYDKLDKKLTTGTHGNIDQIYLDKNKSPYGVKKFNVEELHTNLKQEHDTFNIDGGNRVAVGVSIILRYGEQYEAYHDILKIKGNTAIFLSGGAESNTTQKGFAVVSASKEIPAETLAKTFNDRIKDETFAPSTKDNIITCQNRWMNDLTQAWSELKQGFESLTSKIDPLDPIKTSEIYYSEQENIIDEKLRKVKNFGSAVDSEQYLLNYLNSTVQGKKRVIGIFESIRNQFNEMKSNDLKLKINNTDMQKAVSAVKEHKNFMEVGYIVHIHSTNEVCSCCAYSIEYDIFYKGIAKEIVEMANKRNSDKENCQNVNPFFLTLYSYSNTLKPEESDKFYVRKGINKDQKLPSQDYEKDLFTLKQPQGFFQKKLES